jgi:hypothetical protein
MDESGGMRCGVSTVEDVTAKNRIKGQDQDQDQDQDKNKNENNNKNENTNKNKNTTYSTAVQIPPRILYRVHFAEMPIQAYYLNIR